MLATDRQLVLWEAREIWRKGFVSFDGETTGLESEDQIIQWAVCDQNGQILGSGYVRPTVPISAGAFKVHGITEEALADAPTFDQVWSEIYRLLNGQTVVFYNDTFDLRMLYSSARAHQIEIPPLNWIHNRCAMHLFAAFYGQVHEYWMTYTWKSLDVAVAQLKIDVAGTLHDARHDAAATAMIIKTLAELADKELPTGWHPPVKVPCAGGCNNVVKECWEANEVWYCRTCGLAQGHFHHCPGCHIVVEVPATGIPCDDLCEYCHRLLRQEEMLLTGQWHRCPGKNHRFSQPVVESPDHEELCADCKRQLAWRQKIEEEERLRQEKLAQARKEHRRAYAKEYRQRRKEEARINAERLAQDLPPLEKPAKPDPYIPFTHRGHHFQRERLEGGKTRVVCSICSGFWTAPPRAWCNGIKTYWAWSLIPEYLKTQTQLKKLHLKLAPGQAHEAVMESTYNTYRLYDLSKCVPTRTREKAET